jgi:hypothetical protein
MNASVSSTLGTVSESNLQRELRLSGELFPRLIDAILNRMFDLQPEKATRRLWYLLALFFITGFLISLYFYPVEYWWKYTWDVIRYFVDSNFSDSYPGSPFLNLYTLIKEAFTDPRIFQYFPILLASFFIALQCAALYLADIFELEHPSVARRFLWAVALTGSEESFRVTQGNVPEEYQLSPAFLIGGPGKVVVDLDSAALFEKADGTPHIIGPTSHGKAVLAGFERFRQAIDIRDHYVDLRDQDSKSQSVKSRSLDGIEITATDVRLMFSVYRGGIKTI